MNQRSSLDDIEHAIDAYFTVKCEQNVSVVNFEAAPAYIEILANAGWTPKEHQLELLRRWALAEKLRAVGNSQ